MEPNAVLAKSESGYIRSLVETVQENTGLTIAGVAERLGYSRRQMMKYLASESSSASRPAPYVVQFALEVWCVHISEALSHAGGEDLTDEDG